MQGESRTEWKTESRAELSVKERMAAVTLLLLRKQYKEQHDRLPHLYELPLDQPYSPQLVRMHRALILEPLDLAECGEEHNKEYNPVAPYLPPHKRGTVGSKDSSPGITNMGNNRMDSNMKSKIVKRHRFRRIGRQYPLRK